MAVGRGKSAVGKECQGEPISDVDPRCSPTGVLRKKKRTPERGVVLSSWEFKSPAEFTWY